jgi:hypothetical protein
MEPLVPFGIAFAGFVLGALAFSRIGHWLVGVHGALKARRDSHFRGAKAALASAVLLASGPWLLVALATLAVGVAGHAWAPWLYLGFGASVLFFGGITAYFACKSARASKQHAA